MIHPVRFSGGIPSNFYEKAPIKLPCMWTGDARTYPSNEAYFQAAKVLICEKGNREMYIDIATNEYPGRAKNLGRFVPLSQSELEYWDSTIALVTMLRCNLAKYQQHRDCWLWLWGTGKAPIIEHRRDPIWGDAMTGEGKNLLGKVLELVRAQVC